jgi:hypothetical protein
MRPIHASAVVSILLASGAASAQQFDAPHLHQDCSHAHHPTIPGVELAHACWPGEDGQLTGRRIPVETLDAETVALREHMANRDLLRGSVPNRIDIVFVGDGYTAAEQALFQSDVDAIEGDLFQFEPFITYKPFFRVQRVEVISNESGVDNDPTQGISRDTALNMAFWCGGTERALCVSVSAAIQAAGAGVSTDVDQVIAIANTTKYGGVGYPSSNVGTSSGRNSAATQIVIHELGHSLGNLADEYTYGGPTNYTGSEPGTANVSVFTQSEQVAQQRKWYRWMGASFPVFDNPVGTYEGGQYSVNGIYRPSQNSMMRNLGRRFNAPSAEQLIKEFYREVRPIEDATPESATLSANDSIYCVPVQPDGHDLLIVWELDGNPIPAATNQTTLDLSTLGLGTAEAIIKATVIDDTPYVRDPVIREQFLTETRTWVVNPCERLADIDGNGELTFFDVSSFVLAYQIQDPIGDFNNDGIFNFFDFVDFINEFTNPCGQ